MSRALSAQVEPRQPSDCEPEPREVEVRSANPMILDVLAVAAGLVLVMTLIRFVFHFVLFSNQLARYLWL